MAWESFVHNVLDLDVVMNGTNGSVNCNAYPRGNSTHLIYDGYYGIPQNLVINLIGWLILLLLFTILRKKAWNYGRIALVQRNEQRWTQLFYGDVEGGSLTGTRWTGASDRVSVESPDVTLVVDQGWFAWITAIFRVKDEHILRRSGPDAIQYLSFQRYAIFYLALLTFISLVIILPVNFQGDIDIEIESFTRTTMTNLRPSSPWLWIHVLLSIVLLPIGIYFMRHFSVNLKFEEHAAVSRTLMIIDIPKDKCTKSLLLRHFEEAYPEVTVQDIQLAYNIKELIRLDKKREAIFEAKSWSEAFLKDNGKRLLIYPCICSWALVCCNRCGCQKEDAITYYSQKEVALLTAVDREKALSMERPLGISFITFQTEGMAYKVYTDHQHTCKCGVSPPSSSVSRDLEPYRWGVCNAPIPEDIYWENLSSNSEHWYLRAFCINFFLFFFLFFLTTPFVVISSLDLLNIMDTVNRLNPLLARFLPTLLLWTVAALMPVMVSYSDQFVRHWTRSEENHTIMRKTFIFLLFMIVILPSLGLTSAKAFVEWALQTKGQTMRWECVFMPDNGAFYVNYVITSSLVGNALELIRFPELFMYVVRLCATRSIAEQLSVRKAILWEFPFGTQYAYFLLVFATTVIYSISCPLIAPFGLLYMCIKHCVDRHNIIFAYGPSKISKSIHATAINFVVISIMLLQMMVLFFTILRRGLTDITIFSITFFCLSMAVFIGQIFFNVFKGVSPILYTRFKGEEPEIPRPMEDVSSSLTVQFLPTVLHRRRPSDEHGPTDGSGFGSPGPRSYGTHRRTEEGRADAEDLDINAVRPEITSTGGPGRRADPLYQDYQQNHFVSVRVPSDSDSRGRGDHGSISQNQNLMEPSRGETGDLLPQPI